MLSINNLIASGNPLIWIDSKEYERCETIIEDIAKENNKTVFIWDINKNVYSNAEDISADNPLEFLKEQNNSILIMKDVHTDIKEVKNWRGIANCISNNILKGNSIIILSPVVTIPLEISHYVTLTKLELPNLKELIEELIAVLDDNKIKKSQSEVNSIAETGLGLTLYEFKTALYTSISYSTNISQDVIFEIKKQLIEKNGSIQVYNSTNGFDSLCGLDNMKQFVKKMVLSGEGKGILILGVPGGGKTEFAKRLGCETNRITISLDFGSLMGSYVGETEMKTKEAFSVIDSMNKSIVFIDEIEKGLSGTSAGRDSVSKRQGGQFLKWMQDKKSDSYVVATANDITSLPSEYLRSGRWDAIFFVDMPTLEIKNKILDIYRTKYNIDSELDMSKLNYTGAEIESLCRIASNLGVTLEESEKYVCPIYNTSKESIENLRKFSKERAVLADNSININNNKINRRI